MNFIIVVKKVEIPRKMDSSESSQAPEAQEINPVDCFKILLATDIHLGYKEKDIVTGTDNFMPFCILYSTTWAVPQCFLLFNFFLFSFRQWQFHCIRRDFILCQASSSGFCFTWWRFIPWHKSIQRSTKQVWHCKFIHELIGCGFTWFFGIHKWRWIDFQTDV